MDSEEGNHITQKASEANACQEQGRFLRLTYVGGASGVFTAAAICLSRLPWDGLDRPRAVPAPLLRPFVGTKQGRRLGFTFALRRGRDSLQRVCPPGCSPGRGLSAALIPSVAEGGAPSRGVFYAEAARALASFRLARPAGPTMAAPPTGPTQVSGRWRRSCCVCARAETGPRWAGSPDVRWTDLRTRGVWRVGPACGLSDPRFRGVLGLGLACKLWKERMMLPPGTPVSLRVNPAPNGTWEDPRCPHLPSSNR